MITYQIDRATHHKANSSIRELSPVLSEIGPTLQSLIDLLNEHATAISSPTINNFRTELQDLVARAAVLNRTITDDLQRFVSVSEQAGKHLAAIEEHFGAVLRGTKEEEPQAEVSQVS